jgi:hypothetical protein
VILKGKVVKQPLRRRLRPINNPSPRQITRKTESRPVLPIKAKQIDKFGPNKKPNQYVGNIILRFGNFMIAINCLLKEI